MKTKLKSIPENTVIHTPTEEEANELLAILHANGYKWSGNRRLTKSNCWNAFKAEMCYEIEITHTVRFNKLRYFREYAVVRDFTILTLSEFKERYCEEESQPKFILGDIVKIVNVTNPMLVGETGIIMELPTKEDSRYKVGIEDEWTLLDAKYLKLYTEAVIKVETSVEAKQLNLCELLKGYEGQSFYSPCYGDVDLIEVQNDRIIISAVANNKEHTLGKRGKHHAGFAECMCMLFPSRALYEQYPLDPYTAWMKWQQEQTIFHIRIEFQPYEERGDMKCGNMGTLHFDEVKFRTPADRDKCIEEIKAIIEKYNKK